jgi:SAM-dependent methyltransferase
MSLFDSRTTFERLYEEASQPEDLPWHRDAPWPMLKRVVGERERAGRAVDLGCGTGVFTVYLAQQGYDVTGVDLIPEAINMAQRRAESAGAAPKLTVANVLEWEDNGPYDLVLDASCMHSFTGQARRTYRRRLLNDWLAPGGDYVLIHFAKKHPLDWRPVGPRRRRRGAVVDAFVPPLSEMAYAYEHLTGVPLPVGPRPRVGQYWFRRPGQWG